MSGMTRLVSTTTIRPESGDLHRDFNRRIELTPCDLQSIRSHYMHRGLLFHKPKESPVDHLKASLSQALDRLYPLAGRLVATRHEGDIKTASFYLECNGAGVTFVHSEAVDGCMLADILDVPVVPKNILDSLFPMTGVLSYQAAVSDLPLIAVQVTEFVDGVFVGLSRNHSVADGTSFWDFLNVWSALTRGDSTVVSRQSGFVLGRECFDGLLDLPVRIPSPLDEVPPGVVPTLLQHRVLHFSREKIAELKAEANSGGDPKMVSSLQALMAHLWVSITRSRALNDDDTVVFRTPVGMRRRLQPPLPQSYVGNAILSVWVSCTAGELLRNGMGWAARRINMAIAACDGMETREFFKECTERCMSRVDLANLPPNILLVGGSPWFDLYGNNFGWGRPLASRSSVNGFSDGFLNVFPGAEEGSVDFEAVLLAETFDALVI